MPMLDLDDDLRMDPRSEGLLEDLTVAIERQGGGAAADALNQLFADMGWASERIARARNSRMGRDARAAYTAECR